MVLAWVCQLITAHLVALILGRTGALQPLKDAWRVARGRDHSFCAGTLMESDCDPHSFLLRTCLFCIASQCCSNWSLEKYGISNRHPSSYQIEVILKLAGNCPRLGEDSSIQATVTRSWRGRPRSGPACCAGFALWMGEGVSSACFQWPRVGAVPAPGARAVLRGGVRGWAGLERRAVAGGASEEETFRSGACLDEQAGGMGKAACRSWDPGSRYGSAEGSEAVGSAATVSCLESVAETRNVHFH